MVIASPARRTLPSRAADAVYLGLDDAAARHAFGQYPHEHFADEKTSELGDPAGHAYRGIMPRNRALFLERGHAYLYLVYGSSFMLNVSSETSGVGAGVLIRAIEPTVGITIMERNRGAERVRDLTRGPGRLSEALGIDRRLDGIDLCQAGPLWLGSDGQASDEIGQSKRIGITRAADSPLRFYVRGNWFVSGPQALNR